MPIPMSESDPRRRQPDFRVLPFERVHLAAISGPPTWNHFELSIRLQPLSPIIGSWYVSSRHFDRIAGCRVWSLRIEVAAGRSPLRLLFRLPPALCSPILASYPLFQADPLLG